MLSYLITNIYIFCSVENLSKRTILSKYRLGRGYYLCKFVNLIPYQLCITSDLIMTIRVLVLVSKLGTPPLTHVIRRSGSWLLTCLLACLPGDVSEPGDYYLSSQQQLSVKPKPESAGDFKPELQLASEQKLTNCSNNNIVLIYRIILNSIDN